MDFSSSQWSEYMIVRNVFVYHSMSSFLFKVFICILTRRWVDLEQIILKKSAVKNQNKLVDIGRFAKTS